MLESVDSIMEIKRRDDNSSEMGVALAGPKIQILLPKEDYDIYRSLLHDPTFSSVAVTSIVLPVLMDALRLVATGDEEFEAYRWYANLAMRLSKKELDHDGSYLENGQRLLEMPIGRMLRAYRDQLLDPDSEDN